MKYTIATADKFLELYATGKHTIQEICASLGIKSTKTFYRWKKSYPAFAERLEEADAERLENLGELALSGLAKLLTEHEIEEVTTEYVDKNGKPHVKSRKVVKKTVQANIAACIFTLTNRLPNQWKNRQNLDATIGGDDIMLGLLKDSSRVPLKKSNT